jgi:aryl-phospho-beta-D-glucosidase BglC (GH1 family)
MSFRFATFALLGVSSFLAACDSAQKSARDDSAASGPLPLKGCGDPNSAPPIAKGGYYTSGATVCTADGEPHLFHGVARPSMEWGSTGQGEGQGITAADLRAIASWHANVVRVALNQDFWLKDAALYDPLYAGTVARVVHDAEAAGLDVILDLHWSDEGNLAAALWTKQDGGKAQDSKLFSNQQPMADVNSKQFWSEVAATYKDDGHVLFELYNEPHSIPWGAWLNGGNASGFQIVGMQELYDTVRAAGADNVVIAGGLSYAFDLSGVGANAIKGYNILYASHPYFPQDPTSFWQSRFGYLASSDIAPVILTEFGDARAGACTPAWNTNLIQFADSLQISWTAWAWWAGDCSFPALISDWQYTPTEQGQVVKDALLAYPWQPEAVPSGGTAGAGGSPYRP